MTPFATRPAARTRRSVLPRLEALDPRDLPASAGHSLGPFIDPAVIRPRINQAPVEQNPHLAINDYLAALLGEQQLQPIQRHVENVETSSRTVITQRVLKKPFVQTIYANKDTYTLLNNSALAGIIGVSLIRDPMQTEDTVRYLLPPSSEITFVDATSALVQIPPNGGVDGFLATVPPTNIRLRSDGFYSVDVPRDQIPANAPPPLSVSVVTGELSTTYQMTGAILTQALLTGQHRPTPNAPRTVPGLRLSQLLATNRAFPTGANQHRFIRLMRSAVQRRVFNLAPPKQTLVNETFAEFLAQVDALNQSGAFTPPAPPEAPVPIRGPLSNTLLVSAAAIRDLSSVPAPLAGLPLATITDSQGQSRSINLRGRIDVGFVIERDGDYGLAFIARGPLLANPADLESADTIGGDIRIDVSNAVDLAALEGLRVEEGLTIGAALESTLVTANSAGLETWGVTVGYGSGFQFGTSVSFTRVVKLGNINALLPQFPKM